ncbi:hypothetical protein FSC37_04745 [Piscinibacter aquaticus]|uniref:Cytochrome C oxidase subunit IV family protein n=1 Tax=Piscinibacter aquaticus TaxID=392597 RepID=A0A5C6TYB1_9BURK|nr:hypothetical protein FSC37_04745 [Piscinibacter aquaticus]
MSSPRQRLDAVWVATLLATGITWWAGESGLGAAAPWAAAAVFALSLAKGVAIGLEFMELRGAPAVWRRFVIGWLVMVIALIATLRLLAG